MVGCLVVFFFLVVCQEGWGGESCAVPTGTCDPKCGPHGVCNAITSSCDCEKGYTGAKVELGKVELMDLNNGTRLQPLFFSGLHLG